jgi:hypothetical protein
MQDFRARRIAAWRQSGIEFLEGTAKPRFGEQTVGRRNARLWSARLQEPVGTAEQDLAGSFAVWAFAQQDLAGSFVIQGGVEQDLNGSYVIHVSTPQQDLVGSYAVHAAVEQDLACAYLVASSMEVEADLACDYVVLVDLWNDLAGGYEILDEVFSDLVCTYRRGRKPLTGRKVTFASDSRPQSFVFTATRPRSS